MASSRICFRVDRELSVAINEYAHRNGLLLSQAIREVLRQKLTDASDVTRGWHEGFAKGYGEAQSAQQSALHGVPAPEV